jgi:hypothetical protein
MDKTKNYFSKAYDFQDHARFLRQSEHLEKAISIYEKQGDKNIKNKYERLAEFYEVNLAVRNLSSPDFEFTSGKLEAVLKKLEKYKSHKAVQMSDALCRIYLSNGKSLVKEMIEDDDNGPAAQRALARSAEFLRNKPQYLAETEVLLEWIGYSKEVQKMRQTGAMKGTQKRKKPKNSAFREYFKESMQPLTLF